MKPTKSLTFSLSLLLFLFVAGRVPSDQKAPASGFDLTLQMFGQAKKVKTLTFRMKKTERIDGKMQEQVSDVRLQREPYKVYSRQVSPKEGVEVLYATGERDGQALVNPNGFPWINLRLQPYGNIMRKNQHHTIVNSGYDYFLSILDHLFAKYGNATAGMTYLDGTIKWNGRECFVVRFENPHYAITDYTVKSGETVTSIAEERFLSDYKILELNKSINDYDDVKEGQVIKIPNDYSPRMLMYIDKQLMVPLVMKVYDEVDLFEVYEYGSVKVDEPVAPGEFTSEYEGYNY